MADDSDLSEEPGGGCNHESTRPVRFTWWGGMLGPRVLGMVRCDACGRAFSKRTGRTPWLGIAVYLVATLAVFVGLVVVAMSALSP